MTTRAKRPTANDQAASPSKRPRNADRRQVMVASNTRTLWDIEQARMARGEEAAAAVDEHNENAIKEAKQVLRSLDKMTITDRQKALTAKKAPWKVAKYNIVVCGCDSCQEYLDHIQAAGMDRDFDWDDEEGGRYDFKSNILQDVFLIRDLMARDAAFDYNHNDPSGMAGLQGLLVVALENVSKLEKERNALRGEVTATREDLARINEMFGMQAQTTELARNKAARDADLLQSEAERLRGENEEMRDERDDALRGKADAQKELDALHLVNEQLRSERNDAVRDKVVTQTAIERLQRTHEKLNRDQHENELDTLRRFDEKLSSERDEALVEKARAAAFSQNEMEKQKQALDEAETRLKCALDGANSLQSSSAATAPAFPVAVGNWMAMKMPSRSEPLELFARWVQFHELPFKGIPFLPNTDFAIDYRDVRGHHEVQPRVPAKRKGEPKIERKLRQGIELGIVSLLAQPGRYIALLRATNTSISSTVTYAPLSIAVQHPAEEVVAKLLAAQGLSPLVADDTQQYCYKFLKAAASSDPRARTPLAIVEEKLAGTPTPPGMHPSNNDIFVRPNDLPRKRVAH
ncbi:hypothetical protein C8F04DRAFT_1179522 [Mycena alexandri]|uniref:Uncharacterized protein n=1 Tax=Mycena alexandri TaxID=1745969 RepID=A0AAD6T2Z6_9AGAR|nr:hypothetical protein C8F04DRAFT_1179522 [Mycena alexandri]